MSRSVSWHLKPHKSVYCLNSHDPDVEAKASRVCHLYVSSPNLYKNGELVIWLQAPFAMGTQAK